MVGLNVWAVVSKGSIGLPSIGRGLGFPIRTQVEHEPKAFWDISDAVDGVLDEGDSDEDDVALLLSGEDARISCSG